MAVAVAVAVAVAIAVVGGDGILSIMAAFFIWKLPSLAGAAGGDAGPGRTAGPPKRAVSPLRILHNLGMKRLRHRSINCLHLRTKRSP